MTDQERKAMEMALPLLVAYQDYTGDSRIANKCGEAIEALRQALAQDEQEPVASPISPDQYERVCFTCGACTSKPFVFLTKEDMPSGDHPMYDTKEFYAGMAWAQTKLKEKNT